MVGQLSPMLTCLSIIATEALANTGKKRVGWKECYRACGHQDYLMQDESTHFRDSRTKGKEWACNNRISSNWDILNREFKTWLDPDVINMSLRTCLSLCVNSPLSSIQIIVLHMEVKDNSTLILYPTCLEAISTPDVNNGFAGLFWMDSIIYLFLSCCSLHLGTWSL
jgi:hypothetical protein